MMAVARAPRGLEYDLHPKCPACGHFMKSFMDQPEQDCTSCGIIWAVPTAY